MTQTTITALHLYHPNQLKPLLHKLQAALAISHELWISSANPTLLVAAVQILRHYDLSVRTFEVSNTWHDWSGFLAFFHARDAETQLIIANDSVITRRVLSGSSVSTFIQSSRGRTSALVGELDMAAESVTLHGESSACWISTYLFALSGIQLDTAQLEALVRADVAHILNTPKHFFLRYLTQRRPSLISQPDALQAKLGAMCFERHLTRIAMAQGVDIVHAFAGSRLRKIERHLERLRDA